jgi:hypothetical protein
MKKALLVLIALLVLPPRAGAAWESTYFETKGVKCISYERVIEGAREGGQRCVLPEGFMETYPHPVTLHVPDQFISEEALDLVLYFHGLSDHTKPIPYDYIDSLFANDMGVALSMSKVNAVL